MKKLKVLQLASFEGNIGDNANHIGTRLLLRNNLGFQLEFTDLEIREYFWKRRRLDEDFVKLANTHDLVIIGGGNFFELWVEESATGTSINIDVETLKKIRTPVCFYALGCDAGQGAPEANVRKFRAFLDYVLSSDQYLVSVRNDGSWNTIKTHLGNEYANAVHKIPDGGFFTEVKDTPHPELPNVEFPLGINLAGDMLDLRFGSQTSEAGKISYQRFLDTFAETLDGIMDQDPHTGIVLIPHIFRDMDPISQILSRLDDSHRRRRVTVAPYLHGAGSQEYIFDLYRKCALILGMRFHANVCPIGLQAPTVGLVNYPQVEYLYAELGMQDRSVHVNEKGYESDLRRLVSETLAFPEGIRTRYAQIRSKLLADVTAFHEVMRNKFASTFD